MKTQCWGFSVLAVLAACAACSKKGEVADPASTDSGQAQVESAGSTDQLPGASTGNLGALIDLMVAEAAELPRAEFDPAALAKKLGSNPQAHFEWVRDHTWWAPYRGLLRGPKGVMLDRMGSNLDRAVLLGDLLRRSGHTVRVVHAQLPETRARELVAKLAPIPKQRHSSPAPKAVSVERQRALEVIVPGQEQAFQEQLVSSRRRATDAETLVRSQTERLSARVRNAANADSNGDAQVITALRDHWWIEREENGRWVAMDVLLPNAKPGDTLASASSVSEWKSNIEMPSIANDNWHSVRVSVIVERYQDGVTTESTALETTLRPAEVLDRPITLFHKPEPWPDSLPDAKADPNALGNAAVNVREWVPVLRIGDDYVAQSGFSEGGDLIADPLNPQRDIAEAGGAGFMTGFGEALGGGETAASSITAEWIDYEIHVPGESIQRLRRPVFDVLGPVNRVAKVGGFDAATNDLLIERYEALLSTTDILLQPCDFTEDFLAHLGTKSLIASQSAIRELSRERDAAKARILAKSILERIESWGPLPDLVIWRSAIGDRRNAWFVDRPNVLNYRAGRAAVNADKVAIRHLIDVATNATGVHQDFDGNSFEVRLQQGVADTVAEILALGGELRLAENAASLFAMSESEGLLIGARDVKAVQKLGWPEDVAARLAKDVGAGFIVVALDEPVPINGRQRLGWWRVDPKSGETIGVMDTGYHASTSEDVAIRERVNALRTFLETHGSKIRAAKRARRAGNATRGQRYLLRVAEKVEDALSGAALPPPV
jgi:hypothetical protein